MTSNSVIPYIYLATSNVETQNSVTAHTETQTLQLQFLGPVSRTSRKFFGPEKPFQKLRFAYSKKLDFYYNFKIRKDKFVAKLHAWEMSSFLRYEGNYGTRNAPEKFREFRETLAWYQYNTIQCSLFQEGKYMINPVKSFLTHGPLSGQH